MIDEYYKRDKDTYKSMPLIDDSKLKAAQDRLDRARLAQSCFNDPIHKRELEQAEMEYNLLTRGHTW